MSPSIQRHQLVSIAAILLAVGCAKSIGVAPCGEGQKDCGKQPLDEGSTKPPEEQPVAEVTLEMVETQNLTLLEPALIQALPAPGGTHADPISAPILQADEDGNLVYFFMQRNTRTLYAIPLDDDGNALDKFEVPKPLDWNMYPSPTLVGAACGRQVCVNERGPSIEVSWVANCGSDTCTKREKIFYDKDFSKPSLRRDLPTESAQQVTRDRQSNLFVVDSDPEANEHSVTKLDAKSGKTVWKRDGFDPGMLFEDQDLRYAVTGVPLDDGRFVVATLTQELALPGAPVIVNFIASDGITKGAGTVFQASQLLLLNAGDRAAFVTNVAGDLLVTLIPDGGHNRSVQFVRDGYTNLYPEAAAVDPSGNVYIGTRTGSRTDSEPTLCRVTVEAVGTCHTLPRSVSTGREEKWRFDQIIARDGGEIFVHSGANLVRLNYPE